jgi:5-methylcytosine-specific restriction endonuclease McrA
MRMKDAELERLYRSTAWRKVRLFVLTRDGWVCQINTDPPHGADSVDHIVSPRDGGPFLDLTNLRAACKAHNSGRGAAMNNRARAAAYRHEVKHRQRQPLREW